MLIWPDHNKRTPYIGVPMVEVARLELAASWSLTKRATKLRYTSICSNSILYRRQKVKSFAVGVMRKFTGGAAVK